MEEKKQENLPEAFSCVVEDEYVDASLTVSKQNDTAVTARETAPTDNTM